MKVRFTYFYTYVDICILLKCNYYFIFMIALYYGTVSDDGDENDIIYVRALRYGVCKRTSKFVMESFTGGDVMCC